MKHPALTAMHPSCLSMLAREGASCSRGSLLPVQARPQRLPGGKEARVPRGCRQPPQQVRSQAGRKNKKGHTTSWYDLVISYGRSDWIRTSDPLLPKQVRYHAAPRSVMGCFVRKRPCFGKGGPSGGRKGRCLPRAKGPSPAQDKDLRTSSTQAGQLRQGAPPFQERKEHPVPLPCARGRSGRSFPMHSAQGRSRGVSVPASRPRPSAWAAGPFQTGNGRKRKTPLESGVHFLMGRKMGLEPTATWATTRCSTN